jgi:hypothetical protein
MTNDSPPTGAGSGGGGGSNLEYTPRELREMDESEARSTLTVDQYERWQGIQDLYEDVEETEAEWEREAETVEAVTVNADMEALGTRVEVFGNDLLVHADTEAREFRQAAERLDDEFGDIDGSELDDVNDDRVGALADHLLDMLDAVLVEWDGTEWSALDEGSRQSVLQSARSKWGVDGLMLAWSEIATGIREDREEKVGRIEKFRDAERRGDR